MGWKEGKKETQFHEQCIIVYDFVDVAKRLFHCITGCLVAWYMSSANRKQMQFEISPSFESLEHSHAAAWCFCIPPRRRPCSQPTQTQMSTGC